LVGDHRLIGYSDRAGVVATRRRPYHQPLVEGAPMTTDPVAAGYDPTQERWLPVVGYEGLYEVSDHGNVRSLDRWHQRPASRRNPEPWRRLYPGQRLTPSPDGRGYQRVTLHNKGRKVALVNWLVLEAFVGPRPWGGCSLHGDDDKSNNRLPNLRWGSQAENTRDAVRNVKIRSRLGIARGTKLGRA